MLLTLHHIAWSFLIWTFAPNNSYIRLAVVSECQLSKKPSEQNANVLSTGYFGDSKYFAKLHKEQ